jgi:16S rRNA pseudouridine516 synthase
MLSNLGYCSRKEVSRLIKSRRVTNLDGTPFQKASQKAEADQVLLDGEPLDPSELVLLMNKPEGYTCSHRDRPPLIYELLPTRYVQREPTLSCVGRLDKDTTGLILLTDNGQLLHRLISPNWKVKKFYQVETTLPLEDHQLQKLAQGGWCLPDDDKPLAVAECNKTGDRSLELILTEGRYHQVKRMLDAVGNPLVKLHRSQFGDWRLGTLQPGEWRALSEDEKESLATSCGLSNS